MISRIARNPEVSYFMFGLPKEARLLVARYGLVCRISVTHKGEALASPTFRVFALSEGEEKVFRAIVELWDAFDEAEQQLEAKKAEAPPSPALDQSLRVRDPDAYRAAFNAYPALLDAFRKEQNRVEAQLRQVKYRLQNELPELYKLASTAQEVTALFDNPIVLSNQHRQDDVRSYALFESSVWAARQSLSVSDWKVLIDDQLRRDEARVDLLKTPRNGSEREPILAAVRSAVWRRDGGQCARCGSRERLEFDHIIPVRMGGSNTERNIELLCESCNRSKGATLGS